MRWGPDNERNEKEGIIALYERQTVFRSIHASAVPRRGSRKSYLRNTTFEESSVSSSENTSNKGSVRKRVFTAPFNILNATINHYRAKGGTDRPRFTILLLSRCPRKRVTAATAVAAIAVQTMNICLGLSKNSRDLDAFTDSRRFPARERKQPRETDNGSPSMATMTGRIPTRDINNLQQFRGKRALFRFATDLFLILARRTENNFNGTHKNISDERCELKVHKTVVGSSRTETDCVQRRRSSFIILILRAPRSLQWQWREAPGSPLSAGVQRLTSP
ncbi:hypothetical protein ALC53_09140 [Atta colombica]|uniref:Uncharacterized protein n=1 Tax=Atta colombica TaxID=520822 RepID=A0A151I1E6_9HYME|nr:hypothetical protein ALC53_09140 [Atta colombica]